jgi:DNA-binding CsgD family transcriptional regulator
MRIGSHTGLSLLLAWHYCLWFVPSTFSHIPLMDDLVTLCWLVDLAATVGGLLLLTALLGRRRHLSSLPYLRWLVPLMAAALTAAMSVLPQAFETEVFVLAASALLGFCAAVIWVLWGEHYARISPGGSAYRLALTFSAVLAAALLLVSILPFPAGQLLTAALPLASGALLIAGGQGGGAPARDAPFPTLLPGTTARMGLRSILVVCAISLAVSAASYYLVAIVPWQGLPLRDGAFTVGIAAGAALIALLALLSRWLDRSHDIFKLLPWLLVLAALAIMLYLLDASLAPASFTLALAVTAVFEILLVICFAILARRGFVAPVLAFGMSSACIRLGVLLGNLLALLYERGLPVDADHSRATGFALVCLLTVLVVPLVRQEYAIAALTTTEANTFDLDAACAETSLEHGLSEREAEVLRLLARGFTSNAIAERLVITTNTVNTHIRHIYGKLGIHKRSELLVWLNRL